MNRSIRSVVALAVVMMSLTGAWACGDSPLNPSDYGIESVDLAVGGGTEAEAGRGVTVYYTLWLYDATKPDGKGEQIESLQRPSTPYSFALGYRQVIGGWDVGIEGMKVGGIRRLTIPPEYAYGNQTREDIPPNSTLVFEIELAGVF
jgi:FKBP-type peptidyl-prolyl cis-trans isomerase